LLSISWITASAANASLTHPNGLCPRAFRSRLLVYARHLKVCHSLKFLVVILRDFNLTAWNLSFRMTSRSRRSRGSLRRGFAVRLRFWRATVGLCRAWGAGRARQQLAALESKKRGAQRSGIASAVTWRAPSPTGSKPASLPPLPDSGGMLLPVFAAAALRRLPHIHSAFSQAEITRVAMPTIIIARKTFPIILSSTREGPEKFRRPLRCSRI
jgi:hypothetical protein